MIEVAYLEFLDAGVAASREADELSELKRPVLLGSGLWCRSPENAGHTEDKVSRHASSPERHTANLTTLDDGVTAGAILRVLVLTHRCVVLDDALGSMCVIPR